jgi:formamidopyrimidine-DNA glycosylase
MPEGPEASFITKYIKDRFERKTLTNIKIIKGRYVNHGPPKNFDIFLKQLPLRCQRVEKKGKVIFMYFDKGWCLISKLGMSGWWYCPGNEPDWKPVSANIVLQFQGKELIFSDFRNYGTLTVTQDPQYIQGELERLAPDILHPSTTLKVFQYQLASLSPSTKTKLIEDVIIDQKILLSGIGNYLKAEILYSAQVSPLRKVEDITKNEWITIFKYAKQISKKMLNILLSVNSGNKYMGAMKVYNNKFDQYGNHVATHTTKGGRTTWWVPAIQK